MNKFDPNKVLSNNLIISSAENNFYRNGLCLTSRTRLNRNKLHKPLLIFSVNFIFLIKCLICLLSPNDYKYLFIIVGDVGYLMGYRIYINIAIALYIILAITSQLIYYYNYKNDIKPTFLKVFEMMSGLVSPKSIGLTNEREIYKLIKLSKRLFLISDFILKIPVPIFAFIFPLILYISKYSVIITIIFGFSNSLLFSLCIYYIFSINVLQVIYFYIICFYIKIINKELNENILILIKKKTFSDRNIIIPMIVSLDSLYSEINEYNTKFWSKYLLSIWLIMGSVINIVIYLILFTQMNIVVKMFFIFGLCIIVASFLFIINTSSSVNYEANKSYKLFNSLMASNNNMKTKLRLRVISNNLNKHSNNAVLNSLSNKLKVI